MTYGNNRNSQLLLEKTVFKLLLNEPFYAHIFQSFTRIFTENIETAAVKVHDGRIHLLLNPLFFEGLKNESQRIGLLKHEILHVVLMHLFRDERKKVNPLLYNVAADLVVNQLIPSDELPQDALTLNTFKNLQLDYNKSLQYYIEKLESSDIETDNLEILFNTTYSNHTYWEEKDSNCQIYNHNVVKSAIQHEINKAKSNGNLPGKLSEIIRLSNLLHKSRDNWKTQLRVFIQKTEVSSLKTTNTRLSRRFKTFPGVKKKYSLRMLVALDTSGSISSKDLEEFMYQVQLLSKHVVKLKVIECDCEIQKVYLYKQSSERVVLGRGGTDFNPVIEYFNEKISQYDGMIYFTDGYAQQPSIIPKKLCLFVINNKYHTLKSSKNLYLSTYNYESVRSNNNY